MANAGSTRIAGQTILAVDDEADLLEAVRRVLSRFGHTVLTATGPAEALDVCRHYVGRIDLLLTDVRMPGGSGAELADQAVELRPELAVLYMSGLYDAADDRPGARRTVVAKPFTPTSLIEAVDSVMSTRSDYRPAHADHRPEPEYRPARADYRPAHAAH
ncbi:response regulator [Planosporangium thailandense]|uniref:Response regulator n=1 Tax=Planosporangium thailandense TaxID=765197 RepID=A0ABX0Y096_9ACTN|nr:response regulator [Planosporangium thailandense]NJC70884.1 response regulator [Planosporangium thailandense]